jgi:hypothetical protein
MSPTRRTVFGAAAAAVVVVAVVAGLVLLGSPADQRARRLDDRRLEDLRGTAAAVDLYWTRNGRLPRSLEELPPELGPAAATRDPETGEAYVYEIIGDDRYRLCATFERDSSAEAWGPRRDFWAHPAGRHCFEIDAKRVER